MKKPSLKNKLTADKIEEANRLLSSQNSMSKSETSKNERVSRSDQDDIEESANQEIQKPKTFNKNKPTPRATNTPAKSKQTSKNTVVAQPESVRLVRVTVDIPENLHEKLKIKMILSKQTIKDYLLNFIEKDLAKSDYRF